MVDEDYLEISVVSPTFLPHFGQKEKTKDHKRPKYKEVYSSLFFVDTLPWTLVYKYWL